MRALRIGERGVRLRRCNVKPSPAWGAPSAVHGRHNSLKKDYVFWPKRNKATSETLFELVERSHSSIKLFWLVVGPVERPSRASSRDSHSLSVSLVEGNVW